MESLISITIGLLSSITASFIFLICTSMLRPKIIISKEIAESTDSKGKKVYKIKVINMTKRSITNVRAELHLITPKNVPGGRIVSSKKIELKRCDPIQIGRFNPKDKEADYAHRFQTYKNLDKIWAKDGNTYLRFRIFGTDSLSNLGKVFRQDYHMKRSTIKNGEFEFGNSMEIK